jgi:hypothetical protein
MICAPMLLSLVAMNYHFVSDVIAGGVLAIKELHSRGGSQHHAIRAKCAAYVATIPPKTTKPGTLL